MSEERSATIVDAQLGARLRKRRLAIGMSQERLADELGVTFQQVQKYEKGANRIAASRLWDIAKALDMPVASFFEGIAPGALRQGLSHHPEMMATPEGAQLAGLFGSIKDKAVRRRIVDLVRALVDHDERA